MPPVSQKLLISLLAALAVLLAPASALAAQPKNYWLVSSTGQVFAYGKAKTHGSEYRERFRGKVTGIKGTPNGGGYWIVTSKTHYGFGNASHYKYRGGGLKKYTGKVKPKRLRGKIVGYAIATISTKTGGGAGTKTTPTGTTPTPTVDCSHLTIQTGSLNPATATDPYSQTLSATGVTGGSWSWTIKSGTPPSGLSLSNGGTLSGTPAQNTAGTQSSFTVQAINSRCPSNPTARSFTLSVAVPPMSITTQSLNTGTYGETYNQAMTATGGQPADYQWTASGLPSGLSISTAGVISGTPTGTGTYNGIAITVTDSTGGTAPVTTYYTIMVSYPPLEITAPTSLTNGQATVAYTSVTFTATGGTPMSVPPQYRSSDYEWAATGLPSGMSMSGDGVLSGTPTTPGGYTVAVTLTDAMNTANHITQDFSLTVNYAPIGFTTTTLTAIQGDAFSGQVVGQGGEAPYTMNLLSGSLPTGMTFNNGTITVAPSVASGDYQFNIGVSDSQSTAAAAQETFNMWIAPSETAPDLNVTSSPTNSVWAGYVEQAPSGFTSVSGTLTVPTVYGTPTNSVSPWIGIDGYGTNDLIQAGVSALGGDGTTSYDAWWETLGNSGSPQDLPPQDQFEASPGDTINVNIWQLSAGQWEITLNDVTTGQGFATSVSYTGTDDTAEWIVETPDGSAATGYGATSTFSNLAASQSGAGMLDLSTTGATPSSLSAGGFSITDYN